MPTKKDLLDAIAKTIADYRAGEIGTPDVERWIAQFPDKATHLPMLEELDHVLRGTYLSRAAVEVALSNLCTLESVVGKAPAAFWKNVTVLRLQGVGKSQADLLAALDKALVKRLSIPLPATGAGAAFLYVDDAIFTGRNIVRELKGWIQEIAPATATLTVVVLAAHEGGAWYAQKELDKAAAASGKKVQVNKIVKAIRYEDRKIYVDTSEVLRPVLMSGDPLVDAYVKKLTDKKWPPVWRSPGAMPSSGVFKSAAGRDVLESELLKAGCRILERCPNRKENWRPLGFHSLATLGFGAMLATYRNCPNNAPLALWWGDPDAKDGPLAWYPLLPRRQAGVDSSSFFAKLFAPTEAPRAACASQATPVSRSPLRAGPAEPEESELLPWEDEARQALQRALDGLTFDVEEGVVQADDDYGPTTFKSLDALTAHLEEIYDELWYANVPFDSGEAVFDSDAGDQVTEALEVFQEKLEQLGWW